MSGLSSSSSGSGFPGLFSLHGLTAVVTGARSGIGQAVAVGLAGAGADLVLVGRTDDMHQTAALVGACGRSVTVVAADLSDPESTGALAHRLASDFEVDVLVNNAGVITRGAVLDVTADDWAHVLQVNLAAAFTLSRSVAGAMVERRHGKIVNIASLMAFQGGTRILPYTVSKHAIVGLTRALANDLAMYGVQVNAIAPGYIKTNNTAPLRADPVRNAQILERIPAGRWGEPSDLVGAAIFLCSLASDYVSGHVLAVDGGWLSR